MFDELSIIGLLMALISFGMFLHPFLTYPLSLLWFKKTPINYNTVDEEFTENKVDIAIVFCAYNEAASISHKLDNLAELSDSYPKLNCYVYTDGCTDNTVELINKHPLNIHLIKGQTRRGKSTGINQLMKRVTAPITIFTDANVRLDPDIPSKLLKYFSNPENGCVCGHLKYINIVEGSTAQIGSLYWRLEERIKQLESITGNTMGADGSIFAIRTELFRPVPPHIIDDFYTSLSILLSGKRVFRGEDIIAYEKSSTKSTDEFKRKIRIACRAYNCHRLLWPEFKVSTIKERYKYISHKVIRWYAALFLLIAWIGSVLFAGGAGYLYQYIIFSLLVFLVLLLGTRIKIPFVSGLGEIVFAFVATFIGVIHSYQGRTYQTWNIAQSSR